MVKDLQMKTVERDGRRWYHVNGIYMPSVTTVISEFLTDFSKVAPDILERACAFGTAVHDATVLEDEGRLDWDRLDANLAPCVNAWNDCKKKHKIKLLAMEEAVYSRKYKYAGKFDRIGLVDGARAVIEIKTRKYNPVCESLQTAAYMQAINEMHPEARVCRRFVCELQLGVESNPPFYEVKGPEHLQVFLSALTLFRWKNIQCKEKG